MLKAKYDAIGDEVDDTDEECRIYKNICVGITEELCARSAGMGVGPQTRRCAKPIAVNVGV